MLRLAVDGQENQPDAGREGGESTFLPADLSARIEEIVRAAEREAGAVQRDLQERRRVAEAEAHSYLVDARRRADALTEQRVGRLRELTDELVERAEAAKRQLEGLISAIERATMNVDRELAGDAGRAPPPAPPVQYPPRPDPPPAPVPSLPAQPPRGDTPALAPVPDGSESQPTHDPDDAGRERLDAARLLAIEMAVAGRTRDEVDRHLRDSFRIEETGRLLDDVFGGDELVTSPPSWGRRPR